MFSLYHFSLGDYSLFAVFGAAYGFTDFIEKPLKRVVSRIPDKPKFVMGSRIPISIPESSESLVVIAPGEYTLLERLMLDILSKRWQTLDLISMTKEFKRSVNEELNRQKWLNLFPLEMEMVSVKDNLSSRPRFKKEEELTDCA